MKFHSHTAVSCVSYTHTRIHWEVSLSDSSSSCASLLGASIPELPQSSHRKRNNSITCVNRTNSGEGRLCAARRCETKREDEQGSGGRMGTVRQVGRGQWDGDWEMNRGGGRIELRDEFWRLGVWGINRKGVGEIGWIYCLTKLYTVSHMTVSDREDLPFCDSLQRITRHKTDAFPGLILV